MIKVAVFGIVASLIAMKIKTIRPEIAVVIAVISSILLAMYGLKQMEEILTVFEMIRSYSKIPQSYFQILLKLRSVSPSSASSHPISAKTQDRHRLQSRLSLQEN